MQIEHVTATPTSMERSQDMEIYPRDNMPLSFMSKILPRGLAGVIINVGPPNTAPDCSITELVNRASPEGDTVIGGFGFDVDVPLLILQ